MASCDDVAALIGALLDGELEGATARELREHLAGCEQCRELADAMELIADAIPPLEELDPPPQLAADLAASPCRRWLGLLHQAVDREISEHNLERLLSHLDGCESCRRAWNDLTLIHQVADAMEPPLHLLDRCIDARRARTAVEAVIGRRAATAAAYVLAVSAALMIGNPLTMARSPVVQRTVETVASEVNEVAQEGRGELKVMLWRAWQWTDRRLDAVRSLVNRSDRDQDSESEQGETS